MQILIHFVEFFFSFLLLLYKLFGREV